MKKILSIAKKLIFIRLLFHIVYSVAIASLPYIIKHMIDGVSEAHSAETALKHVALFALMIAVGMAAQYISQKHSWKAEYRIFTELRGKYFSTVMSYPKSRFDVNQIGDYISKIENDVAAAAECAEYVMEIIEYALSLVTYAVFLFLLDYKLALIIYAVTALTLFLPRLTAAGLAKRKNNLLRATGRYLSKLNDYMRGFYSTTDRTKTGVVRRHGRELAALEESRLKYGVFKTFVNVFNGSVMYLIDIVSFAAIALFLAAGTITVGAATATIAYIREFAAPLRGVVDSVSAMKSVSSAARNVAAEAYENISAPPCVRRINCIEVKNAAKTFGDFTTPPISCTIRSGRNYLVQGVNGSGKSTLLKMLAKAVIPDMGQIVIDGVDLQECDISQAVAYVPQDDHIFAESFHDNITWFDSYDAKEQERVERHYRGIMSLSLKEQEDCSRLSGGEKQQLGLLRALLGEESVILLDEPFSAMSPELELEYTKRLLAMTDKTVVMVSHNKSSEYAELFDEVIEIGQRMSAETDKIGILF